MTKKNRVISLGFKGLKNPTYPSEDIIYVNIGFDRIGLYLDGPKPYVSHKNPRGVVTIHATSKKTFAYPYYHFYLDNKGKKKMNYQEIKIGDGNNVSNLQTTTNLEGKIFHIYMGYKKFLEHLVKENNGLLDLERLIFQGAQIYGRIEEIINRTGINFFTTFISSTTFKNSPS